GTVAARLARGRVMLAKRLARHGLAVAGGSLGAALAQNGASAGAPTSGVGSPIPAPSLYASGRTALEGGDSGQAAARAEGVLKAMFLHKIMRAVAAVAVVAALGMCPGGLLEKTQAQAQTPESSKTGRIKPDEGNLKETVLALQKRIWEANAKQDLNAMKNLLADDFAGLDKNGNSFDKGDELLYVSKWCEFDHDIKEARV